ncbi:LysM peptidoglycan-binding domain-containing protein [Photobacterium sp. ZSDE20]|uniref:LysM peptidoglycan-binding domain-containing protein n=1 Tax=Photobacterium pectinilyticum TaxID=2906793 RepID=A0ABT1N3W3_9GAMM|nr:LysM peptidoglycan-binding domain-containing protein [Photobacterium sp. ZSDE20]MCQ1059436.1 LysM peptidoglycan-binding domain-containing protein [Photobacterium sp. ZSDE20]MDD1825132.1 LysM peptidoglycan-binding domain-containing protein [Photobacterium sp. ZSDE20]
MKSRFFLASALLLAGCQITKTTNTVEEEQTNTTNNNPAAQVAPTTTTKTPTPEPQVVIPKKVPTPQEQQDVWQRISMQLKTDIPNDQRVIHYRDWYLRHPSHLNTVAQRAEPFLYMITEEIEKRDLPLELALLPVVESSFDQFAYSHGRAAGLWQITAPTGRSFGLEQNWWYDGRRDVVESTRAALDLLEYLNRKFDGNWLHALAAYNTGEGRVFRAIRNNKAAGKPTDFWSLDLPRETSDYVPKLLAVSDVIQNRDKYGISIPAIDNEPAVKLVKPKTQMDLAMAAKFANVSLDELQRLNPGYNRWATAPEGPSHLLLPISKVDKFNNAFDENGRRGMKVIRYEVKPGDTLSVLAHKHKTTTKQIQRANNMNGTSIRVGRHILIPVAMQDGETVAARMANNTQQSHGSGYRTTYTVQSGDSLWTIARKQKVSIDEITKWNGINKSSPLRVGQKLTLWKSSETGGVIRTVFYKVRSGDNLSSIAQRYKVKVADVVKWNQISSQKYLKPGQQLKLYVDVTKVSV